MTTVLLNETNEDQRNSNAKNNNNEQLFIHSIKRVVIMDVKTQLTIFEHKKKWGGADSTDGVDALVKTFPIPPSISIQESNLVAPVSPLKA